MRARAIAGLLACCAHRSASDPPGARVCYNLTGGTPIDTHLIWQILAYILMALGLIGTVVPLLPGAPLIWGGALLWAWADGFSRVGWPTLGIMAALAIPALLSDLIVSSITGRRAGMSWRTLGFALLGGVIGGLLLSVIPVIGTLLGAVLGALLAVLLSEYATSRQWPQAWQAVRVYAVSFLLGRLVDLICCLAMIGVFAWSVFN